MLQVNEEMSDPCDACGAFSECFDDEGNLEKDCSDNSDVCQYCAPCFGGTTDMCPVETDYTDGGNNGNYDICAGVDDI